MFRFLEYFTKEDAEYAIQSLDGKFLGGNVVRVLDYHDVSPPDPLLRSTELKVYTPSTSTVLKGSRGGRIHALHADLYTQTDPLA